MPFDQYFVELNRERFFRGARRAANDTDEALPYVILGYEDSVEILWGTFVKLRDEIISDKLPDQCDEPFYIFSGITHLTIIGGTYIACDPHNALKSIAVVDEPGKPSLFSLFSAITTINILGGEFTAVYADDAKAFASTIEAQYRGREHNFAIFQCITSLTIIGGTFISVRSTDLAHAFPSSLTATPDFHLFRQITTIDIVGATFTAVLPPSMEKDTERALFFAQPFFESILSVNCVSSRFFFITLQEYIQCWKRSGPGIINTDSNNKTKLLMKNVGNGDINFHIYDGVVSFKEPSLSQPKRDAPFGQQSSEVSSEKSRKMKAAISGLLAIIHDVPTLSSSAGSSEITDEIRESRSESSTVPRPRLEDQDRGTSQKAVKRTEKVDAGAPRGEPLQQHPAIYVSMPTDTNQPNRTPAHETEEPHFIPKERLITIHPLVLPPDGNPTVAALHLASLYFAAALHPADIPDFEAKYIYHDGACTSILLILESAYDAEHLKIAWDNARREALRVKSLEDVILYRGNVTTKILAQSDRDAALNALASYTINKPALSSPSL